jgi:hypothetical protein
MPFSVACVNSSSNLAGQAVVLGFIESASTSVRRESHWAAYLPRSCNPSAIIKL